jgi:hypothetical protein
MSRVSIWVTSYAEDGSTRGYTKLAVTSFCKPACLLVTASQSPTNPTLRIGTLSSILRAVGRHKGVARDDIIADL